MDPLTLTVIAGAALLWFNGRKGRKPKTKTGDAVSQMQVQAGQEMVIQLPRDGGLWSTFPLGAHPGAIDVFAKTGDPLNVLRVRGKTVGGVNLQVFTDDARTDRVGSYDIMVVPQVTALSRN